MKWILLLILPVLQGCLIGPEHEGKEHWAEKILPINLTERRATSQQANWGQYLYEKRMGIAGPKSLYGIRNNEFKHRPDYWKEKPYQDSLGYWRLPQNYGEYMRSKKPRWQLEK